MARHADVPECPSVHLRNADSLPQACRQALPPLQRPDGLVRASDIDAPPLPPVHPHGRGENPVWGPMRQRERVMSQSLVHQGVGSETCHLQPGHPQANVKSQSLVHQGVGSEDSNAIGTFNSQGLRLNPLFIRALVQSLTDTLEAVKRGDLDRAFEP